MINENNRFFRFIWRFNALAIAATASIVFFCALAFLFSFIQDSRRNRHVTNIVNVGSQEEVKNDFVFGYADMVKGTDYIKTPLYRSQSYSVSFYSGKSSGGNEVNYLFLNRKTGESKWLLPTTNQLFIYDIYTVSKLDRAEKENPAITSMVYALVDKDTNGDERLTDKDALTVATSAVDGSNYKPFIDNIEKLYTIKQIEDDKLLLLYQKNSVTISEIYELPSMKKISENTVPKLDIK